MDSERRIKVVSEILELITTVAAFGSLRDRSTGELTIEWVNRPEPRSPLHWGAVILKRRSLLPGT